LGRHSEALRPGSHGARVKYLTHCWRDSVARCLRDRHWLCALVLSIGESQPSSLIQIYTLLRAHHIAAARHQYFTMALLPLSLPSRSFPNFPIPLSPVVTVAVGCRRRLPLPLPHPHPPSPLFLVLTPLLLSCGTLPSAAPPLCMLLPPLLLLVFGLGRNKVGKGDNKGQPPIRWTQLKRKLEKCASV
jgi:hypothetical protein